VTVTIPPAATATATAVATAAAPSSAPADGTSRSADIDQPRSEAYAAQLGRFFRQRWQVPTSVSAADAQHLCVTFQANVTRALVIWHVRSEPTKPSGNAHFDASARTMLEKLMEDRTPLPDPPPEVADMFRGRTIRFSLTASPTADASSCK
jgi:hypothetical protein